MPGVSEWSLEFLALKGEVLLLRSSSDLVSLLGLTQTTHCLLFPEMETLRNLFFHMTSRNPLKAQW